MRLGVLWIRATRTELEILVNAVSDDDTIELDKWLCDPMLVSKPPDEYLQFSAFLWFLNR